MANNVWVYIDHFGGKATQAAWEALNGGKTVAQALGTGVAAVVLGQNVGEIVAQAGEFGANEVLVCDDASLAAFRLEPYVAILTKLVQERQPAVVLGPANTRGRDLFTSLSVDLGVGGIADATALEVVDGQIKATHPVYAGKLLCTLEVKPGHIQLVTLRSRAFPMPDAGANNATVTTVAPVLAEEQIKVKVQDFVTEAGEVSLTDAGVIVSGGRGVGGPEGFEPLRELAAALGGALGASRVAVDSGWIPYAHQVGQTGKTVSPDLYIAAGISGAIQHQAGMRTAKVIVAINKDADAPIFKLARYGIVEDLFKVVPALTAAAKARLGK